VTICVIFVVGGSSPARFSANATPVGFGGTGIGVGVGLGRGVGDGLALRGVTVGSGLEVAIGVVLADVAICVAIGAVEGATLAWHAAIAPATITARASRPHVTFSSPMASLEKRPRLETSRAMRCVSPDPGSVV
jgi:hypothetical protein